VADGLERWIGGTPVPRENSIRPNLARIVRSGVIEYQSYPSSVGRPTQNLTQEETLCQANCACRMKDVPYWTE
jgi:hypothetical protein